MFLRAGDGVELFYGCERFDKGIPKKIKNPCDIQGFSGVDFLTGGLQIHAPLEIIHRFGIDLS